MVHNMCLLHEPMAITVHGPPEIISVLAAGLRVLSAGTLEFMYTFGQYLPGD